MNDLTHYVMEPLLWLKKHKANAAGKCPISLRVEVPGFIKSGPRAGQPTMVRAEKATGIRVLPSEWNAAQQCVRGKDDVAKAQNAVLRTILAKAQLIASRFDGPYTALQVTDALRPAKPVAPPPPAPLLTSLLTSTLEAYYLSGNHATYMNYFYSIKAWDRWAGGAQARLADLTPDLAAQFMAWLRPMCAPTSFSTYLSGLATLLSRAAPGHAAVFTGHAPGARRQNKPRRALTPEQMNELECSTCLPPADALGRDVFLTQYYLHGSRVSAVVKLKKEQVDWEAGRVRFTTMKSVRYKDVLMAPQLKKVLDPYRFTKGPLLFPLLPDDFFLLDKASRFHALELGRGKVKQALIRVSKKLGWPVALHSHIARHTLALRAYEQGHDLRLPQQLLGHGSVAQTAPYIESLVAGELDAAAASIYGT